jgi:dienelactone hydrolase
MRLMLLIGFLLLSAGRTQAAEVVQFPSATLPPTAFALRHLEKQDRMWTPPPVVEVTGYLDLPESDELLPAIVLLPDCDGYAPVHPYSFAEWGYAVLAIDPHGARGLSPTCRGGSPMSASSMALDAQGALTYLAGRPEIDPDRIAVVGWGLGGEAALESVLRGGIAAPLRGSFAAAASFYPFCAFDGDFLVPSLILVGEADEIAPPRLCRFMVKRVPEEASEIDLVIYAGAGHGFDQTRFREPAERDLGWGKHPLVYDPAAHEDAAQKLKGYLDRLLSSE